MMNETKRNSLSRVVAMILTQLLFLQQFIKSTESTNTIALPGCAESCGNIPIPYPFGIGLNCYLSEEFNVTCDTTNGTSTAYSTYTLSEANSYSSKILNISLSLGQARVTAPLSYQCYNSTNYNSMEFEFSVFRPNTEKNKLTVIGCNTLGFLSLDFSPNISVGCLSSCDSLDTLINNSDSCSGIGCCQAAIAKGMSRFGVYIDDMSNNSEVYKFSPCSYAMITEEAAFKFNTSYATTNELNGASMPVMLDWAIGNTTCDIAKKNKSSYACNSSHSICLTVSDHGYICNCSDGYQGNPYLHGGCQDIDECANQDACSERGKCHNFQGGYRCSCSFGWRLVGLEHRDCQLNVALVIGIAAGFVGLSFLGVGMYVFLERRNLSKIKGKYFQQHGGWILLEKMKSNQGFGFTIFTEQQVQQATNNFDNANIIGQGGQGTVYKGTLRDQMVAIKKCKIVNESKKKEFGKEMLILSQINHKNIVKLLGCCLEVEVPTLVYELIHNGTLYHYIHHKKQGSNIPLLTRLRIAHESAEALAYLHTSASPPIFHGDVKSANILLDQNYTAKVSDFGASILAPTDEAQFVTFVQGTCGYLDPEYMQSCQLTDKSDVYSFGVVLLELLTSKPVIDFDAPEEERSLLSRFLCTMEENRLKEIIDDEIKHEDDMELIKAVAELANECIRMKGDERPTMKEVAEELYRVIKLKQHPWGQEYHLEETETLLSKRPQHDIEIEHTSSYFNVDKEADESIAMGR